MLEHIRQKKEIGSEFFDYVIDMIKEFIQEVRRVLKNANLLTPEVKDYLDRLLSDPDEEYFFDPVWNDYFRGERITDSGKKGYKKNILFSEWEARELSAEAQQQYDEVVTRYTNRDGTKKEGWLKAPNGAHTKLNERQWVQVRTPAFKKWFGDWEAGANAVMKRTAKTVSEAQKLIAELKDKPIENRKFGITATLSNKSISKLGSDKATSQSTSPELHALAVANIDNLLKNAPLHIAHSDYKGDPNIEQVHRFGTVMQHNKEYYPITITVMEYAQKDQGKRIYSVEAVDIEKPAGQLTLGNIRDGRDVPIAGLLKSVSDLAENVNNVSKVIDENGEPMVVYHYGTFGIDDFVPNTKKGMHFGTEKAAQKRSKDKRTKKETAMTTVFLNIKKTIDLPDSGIKDWSASVNYAQGKGADGIKYINKVEDKGSTSYVIFSPNQAKSATNNSGDFSENPSILYSLEDEGEGSADNVEVNAKREAEYKEFVKDAWEKAVNLKDGEVISNIETIIAIDENGYKHKEKAEFFRHVYKKHGNIKAEKERGQIAITENDFYVIPKILESPSFVVKNIIWNDQKRTLFAKHIDGTTYVYIVQTSNKKHHHIGITFFNRNQLNELPDVLKILENNKGYNLSEIEIINKAGSGGNPTGATLTKQRSAVAKSANPARDTSLSTTPAEMSSGNLADFGDALYELEQDELEADAKDAIESGQSKEEFIQKMLNQDAADFGLEDGTFDESLKIAGDTQAEKTAELEKAWKAASEEAAQVDTELFPTQTDNEIEGNTDFDPDEYEAHLARSYDKAAEPPRPPAEGAITTTEADARFLDLMENEAERQKFIDLMQFTQQESGEYTDFETQIKNRELAAKVKRAYGALYIGAEHGVTNLRIH